MEFLAGIIVGWWSLPIVALFALWSTHNDYDGWAVFFTLVLGTITALLFDIPASYIWWSLAAYIPIGLAWSMFRWKRYVSFKVKEYNEDADKSDIKHARLLEKIQPSANVSRIVHWVLIWPFSILDNLIGDIIEYVTQLVNKHLIGIYRRITLSAVDKIEKP